MQRLPDASFSARRSAVYRSLQLIAVAVDTGTRWGARYPTLGQCITGP